MARTNAIEEALAAARRGEPVYDYTHQLWIAEGVVQPVGIGSDGRVGETVELHAECSLH